ncbi:hypothetical protein [Sporosarcina trichiuri]|uniref:hypothetical protein n=1 Tax=Sporosarcina trichiuri TaxID=3056445 RepID=UPI0025B5865A|nr:hypothetical protein [Sporosarcina sp. 0.2-SM1T-5]WJY27284.1 hypothetical protein QWT68_14780 [Sporosarcina sp. 0.2-SM1T-5]
MFNVIVLLLFILAMYFVLLRERKAVKIPVLAYYVLLSAVFLYGLSSISEKYRIYEGPVLEGGFQKLNEWVGIFAYLYIVPALVLAAYVAFKLVRRQFSGTKQIAFAYAASLLLLLLIGVISLFMFTLIFYGFAP